MEDRCADVHRVSTKWVKITVVILDAAEDAIATGKKTGSPWPDFPFPLPSGHL